VLKLEKEKHRYLHELCYTCGEKTVLFRINPNRNIRSINRCAI